MTRAGAIANGGYIAMPGGHCNRRAAARLSLVNAYGNDASLSPSSWPALCRPSTSYRIERLEDVDASEVGLARLPHKYLPQVG